MGISNTRGGAFDANSLLLKVGVGLLTTGGGSSSGVGCRGAGDVAVAHRLTLSGAAVLLGVWLVG